MGRSRAGDAVGGAILTLGNTLSFGLGSLMFSDQDRADIDAFDQHYGAAASILGVATSLRNPASAIKGVERGVENAIERDALKEVNAGLRNGHLAGDIHPKTSIPFDKNGYPDFSRVTKAEVKITQTGTRAGDFRAANRAAGLKNTPEGYTWHHHQDGTTMQLVPRDIHAQTGHTGGFNPGP